MKKLIYRKATPGDISQLIQLRIQQLFEEGAKAQYDLSPNLKSYYQTHLTDGSFVAWLALDGQEIIATSGLSFVEKPPYFGNPTGKIGLLSSMYTKTPYRRQGIAKQLLHHMADEARNLGCTAIQVTASQQGVPLYLDFGFLNNPRFFQLSL